MRSAILIVRTLGAGRRPAFANFAMEEQGRPVDMESMRQAIEAIIHHGEQE